MGLEIITIGLIFKILIPRYQSWDFRPNRERHKVIIWRQRSKFWYHVVWIWGYGLFDHTQRPISKRDTASNTWDFHNNTKCVYNICNPMATKCNQSWSTANKILKFQTHIWFHHRKELEVHGNTQKTFNLYQFHFHSNTCKTWQPLKYHNRTSNYYSIATYDGNTSNTLKNTCTGQRHYIIFNT